MLGFPGSPVQLPGAGQSAPQAQTQPGQPQDPYGNNPIAMLVKALLQKSAIQPGQGATPAATSLGNNTQGTYEGNIATPANPQIGGQFGMQHQAQSGIPLPQPRPPTAPQTAPTYGAPPVPFPGTSGVNAPQANPTMQALFSQPPPPNFLNIPM
jgi:hypothetical protein